MSDSATVRFIALDAMLVTVPSGQEVTAQDIVLNAPGSHGPATRFRFLAPAIARAGGTVDFTQASADMQSLCQDFALPKLQALGLTTVQVIVSLSDRAVEFGHADPESTQFFEAYRIENDTCIWEAF